MSVGKLSRRAVLKSAGGIAAITALGLKPQMVLAADEGVLKARMVEDRKIC